MDPNLGQVVKSKAGRDKGKDFIIVQIPDGAYVGLADGDLRRIERPKRKKLKHVELRGIVLEVIKDKLTNGSKVSNSEIRKALAALNESQSGNE